MAFVRGKNGQKGRQRWSSSCAHCQVVEEYQAARAAWDALRESGEAASAGVAGTAGSSAGYYQLSDEEFRQLHPMPQFKDFLIELGARRAAEREEAEAYGLRWSVDSTE